MRLLLGALALLLLSALALAQVSGCGGFVELARPSKEKLDFSQIKLELVSAGGVVKERADCAPNGYYFVPIYDKGEFTLRVKATEGWTFAPAEAKVSVGSDGTCRSSSAALDAKGDLNFRLTGFTLSGSVRHGGAGCSGGLVGIDVTLTNSKGVAEKTSTAADGSFAFANVAPDAYTVSASHPRWQLSADAAKVTVGLGNAKVDAGAFVVMGYDVSGRVQSSNGEAVSGVEFLLYGSNAAAVHCAKPTSADLPADPQLGRPLCSAPSDASGAFSLSGVSCGQFVLRAYYQKAGTTFDLAPASVPVKVTGGSVAVEKPFQVVGFSVRGRVVDAKGEPVADVKISLGHASNLPVAYTDHTGAFRLEGVTAAKYTVLAFKQGYNFNLPAPNTQLSPNAAVLPDITVKSYDLCGRIDMEESSPFPRRRDVTLSGRETRTMKTTDKGLFCFDAAPGKYFLTVVVTAEEAAAGLAFSPPSLEVTMGNAPKSDVVLSQMRNFITGSVFCPGGACTSPVHVHLKGVSRAHTDSKTLDPGASPLRFSFGVLPGNYRVSIESQWLCFESSAEEVDASAADRDVKFTQTGHLLVVETSHADVALQYASQDKKVSGTLRLGPRTKECLASGGVYTLTPASCLNLPPLTYDTSSPAVVRLAATQVKVPVAVKGPKGVTLTVKSSVAAETKLQGTYAEGVNAFTVLASAGETLTLVPSLPADSTQQVYPTSKTVAVTELKCIDEAKFTARDSVYLSGSVTPAIAGVDIFVHDADTNEVLVAAQTDASGRYRVGPLRDDVATRLSASKTGFQLKETSDGQFRALKLCSVAVTVKDEAGNPLPDVVLSLSGDSSYRVNNVTQADGAFTFRELFTGTYYLRPVLKEYVFTPASHSVTLGDGEDKTVAVAAKRVAYSVFGSVRTLSGEPERNFVVVAVAANGDIEETSTDGAGDFRLRGLQPGQSYTVKPRPASDTVERSSPPSMTVNVKTEDARLGAFTVIRKSAKVDLIGRVNASLEFLDSLKVELHQRDKDSLKLVATAALGPIDSFLFPALSPSGAYLLRIKSDLNAATFTWKAEDVAVDLSKADNGRAFVSLNFAAAPRSHTTEVKTRPLWGVLLVLLGLVAALNRERTVRIVRRVSESSLFRGRTAADDDDAPVIRNRQGQIVGRGTAAKKEQ